MLTRIRADTKLDRRPEAEAPIKIARMTLTSKLDGNWSSFQLANSTPPLSVTDSAIAPSARMRACWVGNLNTAKETNSNIINAWCWPANPPAARLAVQLLTRPCFFFCLFLLLLGRSPWAEALLAVGVFTRCCHTCRPPESSKFCGLQGPVSSRGRSPQKFGIIPQ